MKQKHSKTYGGRRHDYIAFDELRDVDFRAVLEALQARLPSDAQRRIPVVTFDSPIERETDRDMNSYMQMQEAGAMGLYDRLRNNDTVSGE